MVILLVGQRIADRMVVPKSTTGEFRGELPAIGRALPPDKWQMKTETLGPRVIEGVEVEGVRIVQTSEDQPPLIGVRETWLSRGLGATVMVVA